MNKALTLFTIIAAAIGCTEPLDLDYTGKSSNSLVVDGSITTDTMAHKVVLSRTVDFTSPNAVYETNATVTLTDGEILYPLNEKEPGVYYTENNVYGVIGKTYYLNITTSDGATYEAQSTLNAISAIDSIIFVKEYEDLLEKNFYKLYFFGQESPELGQYYMWNLYLNDSLVNDTIDETPFQEDAWVNGKYLSYFDVFWLEEEAVNYDTIEVVLEMYSIPKEYYTFLYEVMSETTWRGGPWDPTPSNVSTNITNGGLGFFVAKARTYAKQMYYKPLEASGDD
jgi:hypothetical protein